MSRRFTFNKNIDVELYREILKVMPICCVDALFKAGSKVYLFKRAYEPEKGTWWLVGGRLYRGEHLKDAIIRKAKEEIGVAVKIKKLIGVYENFFPVNRFDANSNSKVKGTHSISVCYLAEPKSKNFKFRLNEEYNGCKIIKRIEKGFHPYVRKVLEDSKVVKNA